MKIETRYGSETKVGSEEPSEKRSCDSKTYRDKDPFRVFAGHKKFCDKTDDKSHDNPGQDTHFALLLSVFVRLPRDTQSHVIEPRRFSSDRDVHSRRRQ
jgi:hypothetical protein